MHEFQAMAARTPARILVGRAGSRYTTMAILNFRADHARAVDAVMTEVPTDWPRRHGLPEFKTCARTRDEYILRPDLGRRLDAAEVKRIRELRLAAARGDATKPSVLIFVGDGLSSSAVEANAPALIRALNTRLKKGYRLIKPFFVRNARVRVEDHIGEILKADVVCMLVGERPGLATAESLSAYVIYRPRLKSLEADRTVISNIHAGGIPVAEGAEKIATLVADAIRHRATGTRLAQLLAKEHTVK